MKRRSLVRFVAPIVSAFAGVCGAAALASSCSAVTQECGCSAPRPIVLGDFGNVTATIPDGAPASLRDIDVTRLVITDGVAVVHYTRNDAAGTATFTFGNRY